MANNLIKAGEVAFEILPGEKTWFGATYTEDKPVVIASLNCMMREIILLICGNNERGFGLFFDWNSNSPRVLNPLESFLIFGFYF